MIGYTLGKYITYLAMCVFPAIGNGFSEAVEEQFSGCGVLDAKLSQLAAADAHCRAFVAADGAGCVNGVAANGRPAENSSWFYGGDGDRRASYGL